MNEIKIVLKPLPDQSKCTGEGCGQKETCKRYLRPEAPHQWWTWFHLFPKPCGDYLSIDWLDKHEPGWINPAIYNIQQKENVL